MPVRTVELVADARLEAEVRTLWQRLAEAGLPSQAHHTHPSNRPHLTLTRGELAPPLLQDVLAAAAEHLPLAVRLDGPALLGTGPRRALVAAVATGGELLALHRQVHLMVTTARAVPARQHQPDRWHPHVTLARRLDPEQRSLALRVLRDPIALEGHWVHVRSYDERTREVVGAR